MRLKRFLYRLVLLGLAAVGLLSLGGTIFWFLDPVGFRLTIFQPVREVRLFVRELDALTDFGEIKAVRIPAPAVVEIPRKYSEHIRIVADLWLPVGGDSRPAMALLHGSAPWGRKAGLIQLLGYHLQRQGWIVVAPDARGFGDTDDPEDINSLDAWNVRIDIQRTVDYVASIKSVDTQRIYVFGHSMGANHALQGALDDARVRALILFGSRSQARRTRFGRPSKTWEKTFTLEHVRERPIERARP
jgi:pimeloyl-ACP methyl ester carboxylesterase